MNTFYESVGKTIDANDLKTIGSVISFEDFDRAVNDLVRETGDTNAPSMVLDHLAVLGVKPAFTANGYKIVPLKGPNIESPPEPFSFDRSPFEDRPARSTGSPFLPLIKKDELSKLYAHQIRWFKHPIRPNVMLPLRMSTYFLTVEHPNSRIYVDLPVVFKHNAKEMRIIRISLNVFENIMFSQKSEHGNFVSLDRKRGSGGVQTLVVDYGEPTHPDAVWLVWNTDYIPYFNKARDFVYRQPAYRATALAVADHLIKFQD